MVILVDDEDRENEGDLTMAAEAATPEAINFMAKYGRGLICLTLTSEKCDSLGLRPMVRDNTSPFETAFTIVAKLSSVSIIEEASFATSVPTFPIAIPMSACFSAGASFTPSPVIATT